MVQSDGGWRACRRVGKARRSSATVWCFSQHRTSSWRLQPNRGTLNEPSVLREQRLSSHCCTSWWQGRSQPNEYRLVGAQGHTRCSVTFVLQRTPLYVPERRYRFLPSGEDRRVVI